MSSLQTLGPTNMVLPAFPMNSRSLLTSPALVLTSNQLRVVHHGGLCQLESAWWGETWRDEVD